MTLTPPQLLAAYAQGLFPMAQSRDDPEIRWYMPEMRGVLPLDAFHVPRSLRKIAAKRPFDLRIDTAFPAVIRACAEREETWINPAIETLYTELWRRGFAHSVECWQGDFLAGGLYGVALGGAFFGESMFSRADNASKIALLELVERLRRAGYVLLDAQYVNEHLKQFGILEIPRREYLIQLQKALEVSPASCF